MKRSIHLFRFFTIMWFCALLASMYFLAVSQFAISALCLIGVLTIIVIQVFEFQCLNCGAHPAFYLLAFWTIVMDFEFYILDVVLLKRCPKCNIDFKEFEEKSQHGTA